MFFFFPGDRECGHGRGERSINRPVHKINCQKIDRSDDRLCYFGYYDRGNLHKTGSGHHLQEVTNFEKMVSSVVNQFIQLNN